MTTGNVVLDGRVPALGGLPSDQWTGLYQSKSWTGGDSPPRPFTWVLITRPGDHTNPRKYFRRKRYTTAFREPHAFSKTFISERRYVVKTWWTNDNGPNGQQTTKPTTVPEAVTFASLIDNNKMNDLVARLGDKVNGGQSFNPAVFLGEGKQTLRMLGSSAVSLAKLMAKYRLSPVEQLRKFSGQSYGTQGRSYRPGPGTPLGFSEHLLEFQYGWRPLINDMYDGAQWLASKFYAPKMERFVVRTSKDKNLKPDTGQSGISWVACNAEAKAQVIAYISESSGNIDLNLFTPAQVAWELLPYSFVCDWALPIGSWLRARGAASALQGKFITTKTFTKYYEGAKASPVGSWYTLAKRVSGCEYGDYYALTTIDRTISSSLVGNTFFPNFKGFGRTFSWEHCLNGVALLTASPHLSPHEVLRRASAWESTPVRSDFS